MRILVSGASGFIGKPLVAHFRQKKYEVVLLFYEIDASGKTIWRPDGGSFKDFDAVVHLAGEPLSTSYWTKEKRRQILASRGPGTSSLSFSLAALVHPPSVFISASAVGFYGNRGEELLDEGSAPGKGFLPHVCKEWEHASHPLDSRGVRTVKARFGMVLGPQGGLLAKMLPFYRLGLGGKMATGQQWMSWVALTDLIYAIDFLLHDRLLHGSVNIVTPQAVRQKEFSQTLASLLHRPAFLALPAWLLRLRFGSMADELLLASARVVPQKLCNSGFHFRYPELNDALRKCLKI